MDPSGTALLGLSMFVIGVCLGGYTVHYLETGGGGPRSPQLRQVRRPGFQWARSDVVFPDPTAATTTVRKVTDWNNYIDTSPGDRSIVFHIMGTDGLERDLTYTGAMVLRFFKCDTPARREWIGDNSEYTRLLAIGKHYQWITTEGPGYTWTPAFGTRERRLRALHAWLSE